MARLNKKLWEAWQNGYIYSIWATSRSAALRALKSKYGGKFTRIRQYPGIGKENPRRVNGKKKKSIKKRITRALKKFVRANPKRRIPRRVKGAKCNGGRSVSLRNFTGRVIKKRDGTVQILGRTRKTK
jgi:hypothetical protein